MLAELEALVEEVASSCFPVGCSLRVVPSSVLVSPSHLELELVWAVPKFDRLALADPNSDRFPLVAAAPRLELALDPMQWRSPLQEPELVPPRRCQMDWVHSTRAATRAATKAAVCPILEPLLLMPLVLGPVSSCFEALLAPASPPALLALPTQPDFVLVEVAAFPVSKVPSLLHHRFLSLE